MADKGKLGIMIGIGAPKKGAMPPPPGSQDMGGDETQDAGPAPGDPCPTCGWCHVPPAAPDEDESQGGGGEMGGGQPMGGGGQ